MKHHLFKTIQHTKPHKTLQIGGRCSILRNNQKRISMKKPHRFKLLLTLLLYTHTCFSAFAENTLVQCLDSLIPFSNLCLSTKIRAYDENTKTTVIASIHGLIKRKASIFYKITTEHDSIECTQNQLFYDALKCEWIPARKISITTIFLNSSLEQTQIGRAHV